MEPATRQRELNQFARAIERLSCIQRHARIDRLEVPPRVEVALLDPPAGAGFGGAGETAFGPALAAIASAVSRATGRPLNRLPLRRGDAAAA